MDVTALGMIETIGLVTAIEAADAGLKAADVHLLGTDYVRGGLVMVRFEGDVAAVRAAVDAGEAAAKRVGKVFSAHVIARAVPEVFCMLASDVGHGPARRAQDGCAQCGGCEGGRRDCGLTSAVPLVQAQTPPGEASEETLDIQREHGAAPAENCIPEHDEATRKNTDESLEIQREHGDAPEEHAKPAPRPTLPPQAEMAGWKVLALRTFVRTLPGFSLTPGEIRYANKQALLDALAAYRAGEV